MKKSKKTRKIFSKETDNEINSLLKSSKETAKTVKSAGAYCSIVNGFCKPLNCESCPTLRTEYPRGKWLCSVCSSDDMIIKHSFWGDKSCELCGFSYGVMTLCTTKKRRYPTT